MDDILKQKSYSFEFFPPRTEKGRQKLEQTALKLAELKPCYFSVTFGAGGTSQNDTVETVKFLQSITDVPIAPHISCIGSSKSRIKELIEEYQAIGVNRMVTLRGDLPEGVLSPGEFKYANELISFIREETGDHFHLEVAAYPEFHPQAIDSRADLQNFKRKVDAGANSAITQYFYNPDAYLHFIEECQAMDVNIPIVPGIMPITNHQQLSRFSDNCGAEIPRWIRKRLAACHDSQENLIKLGVDVVTELCEKLLQHDAPGLHFYTLNSEAVVLDIWHRLSSIR